MTRLETILQDARALPEPEQEELVRKLLSRLSAIGDDDAAIGQRGLAAWTDSVQSEDWAAFYPESLTNGQKDRS